ncbi:DUF6883 domain-containing protein [Dolichospermum sp. LEGE 00246]|nr:DUF6883 domain-containing protein [Dolichospermum sp. LEGE 00246]MBE9256609.1 hypothetical protein [Dolichospermum sp. LEGE 00246]MDK2407901.1 hypothetical protein [Aphanizomenon sp. 202]MDK2458740.1 hypothetical protein [Aphanizomenon sp. PH219]
MTMPQDAIIPDAKISNYLLKYRDKDDKSKFLAQAGFTEDNPEKLKLAILQLMETVDPIEDITNEYGTFYRIEGELIGVNQLNLSVVTVWLKRKIDNQFQFVTLKPKKEKKTNA